MSLEDVHLLVDRLRHAKPSRESQWQGELAGTRGAQPTITHRIERRDAKPRNAADGPLGAQAAPDLTQRFRRGTMFVG